MNYNKNDRSQFEWKKIGRSSMAMHKKLPVKGQIITATIRKIRVEGLILNVPGVASAVMSTRAFGKGEERDNALGRMAAGDRVTGRVLAYYPKTRQMTLEYVPPRKTETSPRKPERKAIGEGTVFLVDTANVLGFTGPEHAAVILESIADELSSQGYKSMFFLEHRTYIWARCHQSAERETAALDAFVKREDFALVSDGGGRAMKCEADAPILQVCEAMENSVVVSKDHYADYAKLHPGIVGTDRVREFNVLKLRDRTVITISGLTRAIVANHVGLIQAEADSHEVEAERTSQVGVDATAERRCGLAAIADKHVRKGDIHKAERIYAKVAKKDPEAYHALAEIYGEGMGVDADLKKAVRYERLARNLKKRRIECEKRYNRIRAESARDGRFLLGHFSSKRREALHIAAISNGHEMICEYFQGTKHGKRMAYGRAA